MADDVGADALYEVARKLKAAGDGELRKRFLKALRDEAKPLLPAVRRSAASRFPARGGLAAHMSKGSRYRAVTKTGTTTAGVSIRANRTDPRTDSEGRIAHPVPKVGGTHVAAHTVTRTSVKTRRTSTKKVAASQVGGKFVVDDKGRRVMVVQHFRGAVGYFRDPIEAGAPAVRDGLRTTLDRWTTETLGS